MRPELEENLANNSFLGPNVLLGVGSEGVVLVRPSDKVVLAEYPYTNIAALLMDPVDNGLTISLTHHGQHDGHR